MKTDDGLHSVTGQAQAFVGKDQWWENATFYQIYPASFQDSNGDGWGDLQGVLQRMDYLHDLGVDVVWVSPIFESPQADMGYDVSDYQRIYRPYGTIEDVDALVSACHERGMKLILDLVVNHTSVEHEWFEESRSSKTNPKRDWYIWKPPRYDQDGNRMPPTNWRSYFAGPTWTWDEPTQEYYHLYAPEQPDLNWEKEECRKAIYEDTMHFWLKRGVDGFRIDTVNKYSKHTDFLDAPITVPASPHQPALEMWCNGPRIHEFIQEMRREALEPYGAVSVGELSNTPNPSQVLPYVSAAAKELDMVFEFSTIRLGTGDGFGDKYIYQPFPLTRLKDLTSTWQTFIEGTDGWTTVFCENHDNGRAVSRFGDTSTTEMWSRSAKTLALWQATMTGSLFLYQGQEIGMVNMPTTWGIEEYKDIESLRFYAEALKSGDPARVHGTITGLQLLGRDHARLPLSWDASPNAGFTVPDATPWMRIHDNYRDINVASQVNDPTSVLEFYKKTLRLRKKYSDLFIHGVFRLLEPTHDALFIYMKAANPQLSGKKALIVLNFSGHQQSCPDAARILGCHDRAVSLLTHTLAGDVGQVAVLEPWEGRVYLAAGLD